MQLIPTESQILNSFKLILTKLVVRPKTTLDLSLYALNNDEPANQTPQYNPIPQQTAKPNTPGPNCFQSNYYNHTSNSLSNLPNNLYMIYLAYLTTYNHYLSTESNYANETKNLQTII